MTARIFNNLYIVLFIQRDITWHIETQFRAKITAQKNEQGAPH
jgi:hypothetical protein